MSENASQGKQNQPPEWYYVLEGETIHCMSVACKHKPALTVGATYYNFPLVGTTWIVCQPCMGAFLRMLREAVNAGEILESKSVMCSYCGKVELIVPVDSNGPFMCEKCGEDRSIFT